MAEPFLRRAEVTVLPGAKALVLGRGIATGGLRVAGTAARIWAELEYPTAISEVANRLAIEFDGDLDEITKDVETFVARLTARGLVETCGCTATPETVGRWRYLRLLKRSLVNLLYPEMELVLGALLKPEALPADKLERQRFLRDIRFRNPERFEELVAAKLVGSAFLNVHTMIGLTGLDNLERCAERIFADGIEGDFLEAGVGPGGAAIFLRALQVAHGESRRRTWLADSFAGLPPARHPVDVAHNLNLSEPDAPWICFSLRAVHENFARYGLLDEGVRFLPGWFHESLPNAPVDRLALLRLDGDLYESTHETLEALFDRVSPGGFVVVDDYWAYVPCRQAVDEFRARRGITDPMQRVDQFRVFWRKSG